MYDELTKYLEHSQFKKAEKYLEKEIIKTPDSVYLLTQMAYVLYKRNKEKRALDYAIRAEVIDNDDPLLLYTSGLILKGMDKFDESISRWDRILGFDILDLEEKCQDKNLALSLQNDARFYKSHCLYCMFRNADAKALLKEHIAHRRRGLESDFTIQEVRDFSKILEYSPDNILLPADYIRDGYPTISQGHRMQNHIQKLEESKDWNPLKRYIRRKCREFPKDYWLKTKMAEYLYLESDKSCIRFAKEAYSIEPEDMCVVYIYACSLYLNGECKKAAEQLNVIIGKGIDYIAYSEHGEGMRWAKILMKDVKSLIEKM